MNRDFINTPQRPPEVPPEYRKERIGPSKEGERRAFFEKPQRPPSVQGKFVVESVGANSKNFKRHQDAERSHDYEPTPDELLEKFRDPAYLPTRAEIRKAFVEKSGGQRYNRKLKIPEWHEFCYTEHILENGVYVPDKVENPVYEFLNEEYVSALAGYLERRVENLGGTRENPIAILEVGAGGGRLTHFLQDKLSRVLPGRVKITATDSGEDEITHAFPVETMDQDDAIKKYRPQIIISCWMPNQTDWTADFRSAPSVQEYIVIGDPEVVGDSWQTWGDR